MCHSPREGMMASHESNGSDRYICGTLSPYPQPAHPNTMRRPPVCGQPAREDFHALRQKIHLVVVSKLLPVSKIDFRL
jgi:hypothetical protein